MAEVATLHPAARSLTDFAQGRLPPAEAEALARHLTDCPDCLAAVEKTPDDSLFSLVCTAGPFLDLGPAGGNETPPELRNHPKFRIERVLGRGGMGVVYKAEHLILGRPVAIKVIARGLSANADVLQRFRREVLAGGRLCHPHIVAIQDAEPAGDLLLLLMEYIEGLDLAAVLQARGPLPVPTACDYVRQAAAGLQHVHDQGMVHRDVKPKNLMVTADGLVKLLDLGLASLCGDRPRQGPPTRVGAFMGTVGYMAPEQAEDATKADARSDVYGLGCTLYCLLTGGAPFPGTQGQILKALFHEEPRPLHEVRPDVPVGLSAVVARMLTLDPGKRFQTAAEAGGALLPFCASAAVTPSPEFLPHPTEPGDRATVVAENTTPDSVAKPFPTGHAPRRRFSNTSRWLIAGGVVAGLLGVAAGGWFVWHLAFKVNTANGDSYEFHLRVEPAPPTKPGPVAASRQPSTVNGGDWKVEGRELVQAQKTTATLFFGDVAWEDYDVSFEAKTLLGREGCKLSFRAADVRNYYCFAQGTNAGTQTEVAPVVAGDWLRNVAPYRSLAKKFEPNRWYAFRVEARGDRFRCFIDGQKQFEFTDARFPRGQVALGTWDSSLRWRDIKVTAPDGKVLWEGPPELLK